MDWQTLIVILIVVAAAAYAGRRVLSRLKAFGSSGGATCDTGCGACGGAPKPVAPPTPVKRTVMVELTRQKR